MAVPPRRIELADLRRVHELTSVRFPHEYLDVGLGAIGLFLHDSPRNAGYRSTPVNSLTFASLGVDGIHLGLLTNTGEFNPMTPVVITIPMELETPNFIVGETLQDFLCLGCRNGYGNLANLHIDLEGTLNHFQTADDNFFDERAPAILHTLSTELRLEPWPDVQEHFAEIQSRFMRSLRLQPR